MNRNKYDAKGAAIHSLDWHMNNARQVRADALRHGMGRFVRLLASPFAPSVPSA